MVSDAQIAKTKAIAARAGLAMAAKVELKLSAANKNLTPLEEVMDHICAQIDMKGQDHED